MGTGWIQAVAHSAALALTLTTGTQVPNLFIRAALANRGAFLKEIAVKNC